MPHINKPLMSSIRKGSICSTALLQLGKPGRVQRLLLRLTVPVQHLTGTHVNIKPFVNPIQRGPPVLGISWMPFPWRNSKSSVKPAPQCGEASSVQDSHRDWASTTSAACEPTCIVHGTHYPLSSSGFFMLQFHYTTILPQGRDPACLIDHCFPRT